MKTYTELYEKIRKKMAAVCGDSAVMSYPVPAEGKKEMVFIYPSATCLIRTRPYAVLLTAMEDGAVLLYQNCYGTDYFAAIGHPFEKKISYQLPESIGGDVKIFKKIQEKLRARYDEVREFAFSEDLSEEQKKTLGEYQEALEEITPPDLMPFYREMGKAFWRWIEDVLK